MQIAVSEYAASLMGSVFVSNAIALIPMSIGNRNKDEHI